MRELVIIAGPYGIGKARLALKVLGQNVFKGMRIDPQDIYAGLQSHYAIEAGRPMSNQELKDRTIEKAFSQPFRMIRKKRDLSVVMTLGQIEDLDLFDAGNRHDYQISLFYFGTQHWQRCINSVKNSANHWQKDLSQALLHNNYIRSLALLPGAIVQSHRGIIFDVNKKGEARQLLSIENGRVSLIEKALPQWVMDPLQRCI